jgi:type IV pilus assembly protein PilM
MITDIFIPEKIGSYYLLPKRILGFDLTKTHVYASQLYLSGNSIILEKFYQEVIDPDTTKPYPERVAQAIRTITDQAPPCNEIRSSLSSIVVVFKELTVPFLEPEKISMILYFEIEQYLPFPLQNALVDFIITKQNNEEKTSTIFVAAVQKEYVATQLAYFELAGINPQTITLDLFDLYGFYREIPAYNHLGNIVTLIDIEFNATRIAFIVNKQLKLIRTLPRGIAHVAKNIAQNLNIQNGKALEDIIRFGLEKLDDENYKKVASIAMNEYLQDIKFTLQSFLSQTIKYTAIDQILLLGRGSEINHIEKFFSENLQMHCSIFDSNALLKMSQVTIKNSTRIPRANVISLSTTFPSPITENFNLRQQEFAPSANIQFYKQFFCMVTLTCLILMTLFGHSYWQVRKLHLAAQAMERSVITKLNELDLTDARDFKRAIDDAEEKVSKEEELWFGFSRQTRFSFLKALQDLSTAIDRKSLGLQLKKMIITTTEITIEGEVKGFEELKLLERALKESKLFAYVPTLQELKFSEKLLLRKNSEGAQ